jgi:non-specific serine/threonine protein kinase
MGEYAAACATFEESLAIRRELGDRGGIAQSLTNLSADMANLGELDTARVLQEEALSTWREMKHAWSTAIALRNLASIAFEQGDFVEARALLEECLVLSQQLGVPVQVAACLLGLASVATAQGTHLRAARLFGAAEACRERLQMPVPAEETRRYTRDLAAARAQLDEESFATAWAEGRAMPSEVAIAYALGTEQALELPAATRPGRLSAREFEVAELIARGLTNRQIADELVIAKSTVDRHVVHVLDKLGLSGRTQIAVWMSSQSPAV